MKESPNRLLAFARLAAAVAADELPAYSHPKSPKTFTQPQLLACLLLKAHLRQTYRGTADLLGASDGLRAALGLRRAPDHSTLQKFAERAVTPDLIDQSLAALLARAEPPQEA